MRNLFVCTAVLTAALFAAAPTLAQGQAKPAPGSPEGDRFELLGLVIARYEEERWPITEADPLAVIQVVMEGRGYGQSDLAALLGSRSRASEILNGRRALSLDQIRKLSREWRIPAAALIGEPAAA